MEQTPKCSRFGLKKEADTLGRCRYQNVVCALCHPLVGVRRHCLILLIKAPDCSGEAGPLTEHAHHFLFRHFNSWYEVYLAVPGCMVYTLCELPVHRWADTCRQWPTELHTKHFLHASLSNCTPPLQFRCKTWNKCTALYSQGKGYVFLHRCIKIVLCSWNVLIKVFFFLLLKLST